METKLNTRRLALSLSLAGAILVPICTGSLSRFIRHPVYPAWVERQSDPLVPSEEAMEEAAKCMAPRSPDCFLDHPQALRVPRELKESPPREVKELDIPHPAALDDILAARLARDIILGALVPPFLVLVFPSIVRRYLRWLMS